MEKKELRERYLSKIKKSVIIIKLPYKKGTTEYWNALDHLQEWSHINADEIEIIEKEECK